MQGFDVILGGVLIVAALAFCLVMMFWTSARSREQAAEKRVGWVQQHIKSHSLSLAWRWFYRCGYRRGKKRGLEVGRQLGQRIEVTNRCEPHRSSIYPQLVRLDNGSFVQGWFCTNWEAHTEHVETGKIEHPFPVKRFEARQELQSQLLPLTETQEVQIVKPPKKIKLSS
jgi:hypothetical protein